MSKYTVNLFAKSAGVSVRTLHHYHEIGLLVPRNTGANGYRYYGEAEPAQGSPEMRAHIARSIAAFGQNPEA